jgi:hypothetical protein
MKKNKNATNHYWLCAISGALSAVVTVGVIFFVMNHSFTFNWPITISCKGLDLHDGELVMVEHNGIVQEGKVDEIEDSEEFKTLYGCYGNLRYPILIIFGEYPFEPGIIDSSTLFGDNWERYSYSEIISVKDKK